MGNIKGQALIETLIITIIITALSFATVQVSLVVINDLICNEAAFAAARVLSVSGLNEIEKNIENAVSYLLFNHLSDKNMMYKETTYWNKSPLGCGKRDFEGRYIDSYTVKVKYSTRIMFPSLFGKKKYENILEKYARARLIKSPDERYYNKAYAGAKEFE